MVSFSVQQTNNANSTTKIEPEAGNTDNDEYIAELKAKIVSLKQDIELHERHEWENEQWVTTPMQIKTKLAETS